LISDQALELRKCQILMAGAHRSCWTVEQRELIDSQLPFAPIFG
jgi:hypothetical protein